MSQRLEQFNNNIIQWYEFEKRRTILQIGRSKIITEFLEDQFNEVRVIDNADKLSYLDTKVSFDYIIIYGYEKQPDLRLNDIEKFLNFNGKILLIGDNQFGINRWSKYSLKNHEDVLSLEKHYETKITLNEIKRKIRDAKFSNINIFYVFPNYRIPEIIINEQFKIDKNHIDKYVPDISINDIKLFDEIKVLKAIIKSDCAMLKFFSNAFFIEISKNKINNRIKYASFNNCRKDEYRLITLIKDDVVEKIPATKKAITQINNIKECIEKFEYKDVELLDYVKENKIYSKLVENEKTLDIILAQKQKKPDEIIKIFNDIRNILMKKALSYDSIKEKLPMYLESYKDILAKMNFLENAFWDMIPKNCFYKDGKYLFFDQEWREPYLPLEFIIYRGVVNSYDLVKEFDVNVLFEKLEILEYIECFKKIDSEIRSRIIDNDIYQDICNKNEVKSIDNYINDNIIYKKNNQKQDEYIKQLENLIIPELKRDNQNKQKYIEVLEGKLQEKDKYIENLEKKSKRRRFKQ